MSQTTLSVGTLAHLVDELKTVIAELEERVEKLEARQNGMFNTKERCAAILESNPHGIFKDIKEDEKQHLLEEVTGFIARRGLEVIISDSELFRMLYEEYCTMRVNAMKKRSIEWYQEQMAKKEEGDKKEEEETMETSLDTPASPSLTTTTPPLDS